MKKSLWFFISKLIQLIQLTIDSIDKIYTHMYHNFTLNYGTFRKFIIYCPIA